MISQYRKPMETSREATKVTSPSRETQEYLLLNHIQAASGGLGINPKKQKRNGWAGYMLAGFAALYFIGRML